MPTKYNIRDLRFDKRPAVKRGYCLKTNANPAAELPATQFSLKPRLLPPGGFSFPYHWHRCAEELFLVLSGTMTVRTPGGMQKLNQGEVMFFEKGPAGAHQLYNPSRRPCVYLDLAIKPGVDVVEYPDSGKLLIQAGGIYQKNSAVGYFAGEETPWTHWRAARRCRGKTQCLCG